VSDHFACDGSKRGCLEAGIELAALRADLARVTAERDTWRDRALRAEADLQNMLQGGHSLEGMG
jgi:hypothetical protein